MTRVSVIITTHNQAVLAGQAVESVLAQTFRDFEILVIDNESLDNTLEILSPYSNSIAYIRQPHQGKIAARLTGLQAAKGDLLLFMGAGDLLPIKKLERQVHQLEMQPKLGLAYFGGEILTDEATQIIKELDEQDQFYSRQVAEDLFLSGCPLIRRTCLEQLDMPVTPSNLSDDWNPWQKLAVLGYEVDPVDKEVLCKEHLIIFLQKLQRKNLNSAQRHMAEAVRLAPEILREPAMFEDYVSSYCQRPDISNPEVFVETLFKNLPACAQDLHRVESSIKAQLSFNKAFQSYVLGNMSQVRRDVYAVLRYDLSYLKKRRVLSVFSKSLIPKSALAFLSNDGNEFEKLRSILQNVQETLSQSVTRVEPTRKGIHHSTYLIRTDDRPFILRLADEEVTAVSLRQNMTVTEQIRSVGLPVPRILAYNLPAPDSLEPAWTAEEWVPGHHFIPRNMSRREAQAAAIELGQYLRRLHSIETGGFGSLSPAPEGQSFEQWLDTPVVLKNRSLEALPVEIFLRIEAASKFLLETYQGEGARLCHADLHAFNILVDKGHISAMIDWNEGYGCDPALDIATYHFWTADEQTLTHLLQAYAPVDLELFRRRIMAGVVYTAAFYLGADFLEETHRKSLKDWALSWLTGDKKDILCFDG